MCGRDASISSEAGSDRHSKERKTQDEGNEKIISLRSSGCNDGCYNYGGVGLSSITAYAADNTISTVTYTNGAATAVSGNGGDGSITITLPETQTTGTESSTTGSNKDASETLTYTYKVYKVFDAKVGEESEAGKDDANIAYTLPSGKDSLFTQYLSTYFDKDSAGNITAKDGAKNTDGTLTSVAQSAIKNYLGLGTDQTADDAVAAVTVKTKDGGTETKTLQITGLKYGYYYITTTTGSLVTVDSTHKNAKVIDKNTLPSVDKTITAVSDGSIYSKTNDEDSNKKAIAAAGSTVTFRVGITIGKGATNYVFKDKMDDNLSYVANSIKVYDGSVSADKLISGDNIAQAYSVAAGEASDNYTFKITFTDTFISTRNANGGYVVYVEYQATVGADGLYQTPAENDAWVEYGDGYETTHDNTEVYNATLTVNKTFSGLTEGASLPEGQKAEFVLSKTVPDTSEGATEGATKTVYYAIDSSSKAVSWVDSTNDATKIEFTKNESKTFTGLANGTYTLTEITYPEGYNKAADTPITIENASWTGTIGENQNATGLSTDNLNRSTSITNTAGTELPSTGGIGTTIFYVIGGVLVLGAAVLLIARKRRRA